MTESRAKSLATVSIVLWLVSFGAWIVFTLIGDKEAADWTTVPMASALGVGWGFHIWLNGYRAGFNNRFRREK